MDIYKIALLGYIKLIIGSILVIIVLKPIYSFFEVFG